MEDLRQVLTIGREFFSQGWLLGLLFLWVLRHDVLKPLRKQINELPGHFGELNRALSSRNEASEKIEKALYAIAESLKEGGRLP